MSAFVVEDQTINTVVSWLDLHVSGAHASYSFKNQLDAFLGEHLLLTTRDRCWRHALAHAMFKLNIQAVDERYGVGKAATSCPLDFQHQLVIPPATIQVLKSLQCWLYQCSEGDVPNHPLYQFFDRIIARYLLEDIVYALPDWEHARWG